MFAMCLTFLVKNGWTPAHIAAYWCHVDVLRFLLHHGSAVHLLNKVFISVVSSSCYSYRYLPALLIPTVSQVLLVPTVTRLLFSFPQLLNSSSHSHSYLPPPLILTITQLLFMFPPLHDSSSHYHLFSNPLLISTIT